MTTLLFDEQPLVIPKTLAKKIGYHNAVFLQQLHYWLLKSTHKRDDIYWIYKTYSEWSEELALSESTVKRIVKNLKKEKFIAVENFNELKIDKTNWYTINYLVLYEKCGYNDSSNRPSIVSTWHNGLCQSDTTNTIEYQYINNNSRVKEKDVVVKSVIEYLNSKANKKFTGTNKETVSLIKHWVANGYTLEDFKAVIDAKVLEWANNSEMNKYLRPSTLFRKGKFENYVNACQYSMAKTPQPKQESYEEQMQRLYGENWSDVIRE